MSEQTQKPQVAIKAKPANRIDIIDMNCKSIESACGYIYDLTATQVKAEDLAPDEIDTVTPRLKLMTDLAGYAVGISQVAKKMLIITGLLLNELNEEKQAEKELSEALAAKGDSDEQEKTD